MAAPALTVVIPTRNRAETLRGALRSLEEQRLPPSAFEVLVVDNGSTDETRRVVEASRSRIRQLRYLYAEEPGLHVGRHLGLQHALGECLVFADDDIEATPTWLAAVGECFADEAVALVGGNNLPRYLEPPPDWVTRLWERSTWGGHAIPGLSILELPGGRRDFSPYCVWGCNFAIRKSVLLAAGGFHPDSMPAQLIRFRGDGETHVSEFVADSGLRCVFHPGASVHHLVPPDRMTLAYFRQRAFNQGVSESYARLRRMHGVGRTRGPAGSWRGRAKRAVRGFGPLGTLYRLVSRCLTPDAALRRLAVATARGYQEGYTFHQTAFRSDSEVRAWVLRPVYLAPHPDSSAARDSRVG